METTSSNTRFPPPQADLVPLREAVKVWMRVAALSFGGPAGQIAVMHRIVVDEKRWIGEQRFLHALNYCMLLPGPEAHQLAIYLGWLLNRTRGGLIAGALFVLPGFIAILGLSYLYAAFGNVDFIVGLFFGLKAAVLAIVLQAVVRIGARALRSRFLMAIAALSFLAIFVFRVPFPLIIAAAATLGYIGGRRPADAPAPGQSHGGRAGSILEDRDSLLGENAPAHARPDIGWSLRISAAFAVLWLAPVLLLSVTAGTANVFTQIAIFFSEMALVTFGGAYAVLAYVAQEAVQHFGWLKPGEMLDGLGMAETTPGPLIMVVQFVGFMGAFRNPGTLAPMLAGSLAALLTTWVTFLPSFLWIFLGAPFIERLRGNRAVASAMAAITAAVVGVILNLALWFGIHTLFTQSHRLALGRIALDVPVLASLDVTSFILSAGAVAAIFLLRWPVIPTLLGCGVCGVLLSLATGG